MERHCQYVVGYWTESHQNSTQCREIHATSSFEIRIAILQFVSEWQHENEDWSAKNADFSTLIGYHGNVP